MKSSGKPAASFSTLWKKTNPRIRNAAIGALSIGAVALLIAIVVLIRTTSLQVNYNKAQKEAANATANAQTLERQVATLTEDLDDAKSQNASLGAQVTELQEKLNTMEGSVNQSTYDKDNALRQLDQVKGDLEETKQTLSTTQEELATTQEALTAAQEELTTAQEELEDTKSELSTTKSQLSTAKSENESLSSKVSSYESEIQFFDSNVVFVVSGASDRYYHKYSCPNFTGTRFTAYSPALAAANDYVPCPICSGGTATPSPSPSSNPLWPFSFP